MKRVLLNGLAAVGILFLATPDALAQSLYYVRPKLIVNSPASIQGQKNFTRSVDGSPVWGGNPDVANIVNTPVSRVQPDSLGCTAITTPNLSGKAALIFRGDCEFGAKALAAQTAGAKLCIIVNNIPGEPVGMGAGAVGSQVTIPVFMVSQDDGQAMNTQIANGQSVTVTYSRWGFGFANDLGITQGSMALPHAQAIPLSQMGANNGNPPAYRNYMGAFVANFGTATQNNVRLVSTVNFRPTGSSTQTFVRRDSIVYPVAFPAIDSIIDTAFVAPFNYVLNPTTNGQYSFRYEVKSNTADQQMGDNIDSVVLNVNDSIFSKGRYDFNTYQPLRTLGLRFASTSIANLTWGPLFYMAKSKYQAVAAQYSVSINGSVDLTGTGDVFCYLFKWTDGANSSPMDSVIQGAELKPVGISAKVFQTGDSSGEVYTVPFTDFYDDTKPAVMQDSGWYWVGVQIDNTTQFLGIDERTNYFVRSYAAFNGSSSFNEKWASLEDRAGIAIDTASSIDTINSFPFFVNSATNINQIGYVSEGEQAPQADRSTPAVAFHISRQPFTTSIGNGPSHFTKLELFPNPATKTLNVSYDLATAASRATFHIVNATGHSIRKMEVNKTKANTVSFSVADLAAGQYYLIMGADGKSTARPFTVGVE